MLTRSDRSHRWSLLRLCVCAGVLFPATAVAQRSDVVTAPDPASSLAERWAWAEREAARRGGPHWIGYSILRRMGDDQWIASGGVTISDGQVRFRGTPLSRLLGRDPVVDAAGRREVAILLFFPGSGSQLSEVDVVRRVSIEVPVELDGHVVLWLDGVSNQVSIPFLREVYGAATTVRAREHILEAIGTHDSPELVVPFLRQVALSDDVEELRAEAAEELGEQTVPEALELLEQLARTDASTLVRREAAESMGEIGVPAATDVLIRLIPELDDVEVRQEAVEALVERPQSAAVVAALVRIAFEDPHRQVQNEAIEALAEVGSVDELIRVARTHPDRELRREAIEALGESDDPRAREALLRILDGR